MLYLVRHLTRYLYSESVAESQHLARLRPPDGPLQKCLRHELRIFPEPGVREERTDAFGNVCTFFAMQTPHEVLSVETESLVETLDNPPEPPAPDGLPAWETVVETLAGENGAAHLEAQPFRFPSPNVPVTEALAAFARGSFPPGRSVPAGAMHLTARIFREFTFDPAATTVSTPVETVLKERRGVCQDFAHLAIAALRSLGLSARYVSGYLETLPPPGKRKLIGSDASHAWISVYCPAAGWVDFDPTNNCIPGARHLRLAAGRDFSDVSPLRGVIFGGGEHKLRVMVDVLPQPGAELDADAIAVLSPLAKPGEGP